MSRRRHQHPPNQIHCPTTLNSNKKVCQMLSSLYRRTTTRMKAWWKLRFWALIRTQGSFYGSESLNFTRSHLCDDELARSESPICSNLKRFLCLFPAQAGVLTPNGLGLRADSSLVGKRFKPLQLLEPTCSQKSFCSLYWYPHDLIMWDVSKILETHNFMMWKRVSWTTKSVRCKSSSLIKELLALGSKSLHQV